MLKYILAVFALLAAINLYSQNPSWHVLPNAPSSTGRLDDIYFINEQTGWTFNYYPSNSNSYAFKTTNGGNSWDSTLLSNNIACRSMGFFNAQYGIIGTLTPGKLLYHTTNGGELWKETSNRIQGTVPRGICGISIVDSLNAYACGKYNCPAYVIKTTDAGESWVSLPMDSSVVKSLIDCYFWSADSGIVVGGYAADNIFHHGYSVILMTEDGGTSWQRVFASNRTGEWCWKISAVTMDLMFVSIEGGANPTHFLKTTNGGLNWIDLNFLNIYDQEGIGFINENTGWIGGWTGPTYQTTNGGANWQLAGWGINVNRIRFISDTIGYAVGKTVYKYTLEPIGIQPISQEIPKSFIFHQNYPNPFNPNTIIRFETPEQEFVTIKIYNALGAEIETILNEEVRPGGYQTAWDASKYPSGVYFYKIISNSFTQTKKMILLK